MAATRFTVLTASVLVLAGCVPQQKYDALLGSYRSQEQQLLATQSELDTLRANESRLRSQLSQAAGDLESMQALRDGKGADLDDLIGKYEALLAQVGDLGTGPLPEAVNEALESLVAQYPDILSYDARRGMLRFSSDFTFDSGSASLKSGAADLLVKLASVINAPEVNSYEVVVVGHTDNVPIRKAATAAQHPTNLHLSAHRAISVRDALVRDGVAANRFEVAGYGEYRPVVANGPRGALENRRVEIFLTPRLVPLQDVDASEPSTGRPTGATTSTTTTDDEPTK